MGDVVIVVLSMGFTLQFLFCCLAPRCPVRPFSPLAFPGSARRPRRAGPGGVSLSSSSLWGACAPSLPLLPWRPSGFPSGRPWLLFLFLAGCLGIDASIGFFIGRASCPTTWWLKPLYWQSPKHEYFGVFVLSQKPSSIPDCQLLFALLTTYYLLLTTYYLLLTTYYLRLTFR